MARVVVLAGPVQSTFFASRELARRLAAAGHDTVLARPEGVEDRVGPGVSQVVDVPSVEVNRFRYPGLPADPVVAAIPEWKLGARRRAACRQLGFEHIRQRLDALAPDLVLVDIELAEHALVALTLGVPVAGLSSFIDPWRHRGVPPLHSPTVPLGGGRSDAAIAREWTDVLVRRRYGLVRQRVGQRGLDRLAVLRSYARGEGLAHRIDATQWLIPGMIKGLPVLVMSGAELDFPHRRRPEEIPVGPMLREDTAARSTMEPELATVVSRTRAEGRTLLYCCFGTVSRSYDRSLLARVVGAVARHPEWQLVVSLGGAGGSDSLPDELPGNVAVFERVPQLEVLEQAELAVHPAGANTIHECLLTGTPTVSYPGHGPDQPGNAARLTFHRVGVVGDRDGDTVDDVEARLVGALGDTELRARVQVLGAQLAGYRKRRAAETTIDALLTGDTQPYGSFPGW